MRSVGNFDGFIVGVFSIEDFFGSMLSGKLEDEYVISLSYEGSEYFRNKSKTHQSEAEWQAHKKLRLYDKTWLLVVEPTAQLISQQKTFLPVILLFAGLIIAFLAALTTRYIIIAKSRTNELVASNRMNTVILTSAHHLIVATDMNGVVTAFNKAAEQALGYAAEEVIGKHTPALWHDGQEVVAKADSLTQELGIAITPGFSVFVTKAEMGSADVTEWTLIRKDGTRFPANLTVTCLREGFRVIGYLGVLEDISLQKAWEAKLKESLEFCELVIETMPDYLFVKDKNFKIVQANTKFLSLYPEYMRHEVIGTTTIESYSKEEAEIFLAKDKEAFETGFVEYEESIKFPNGEERILQTIKVRFYNNEGLPFILGVSRDISERKTAEKARLKLLDQLTGSNTELERFAYIASHDMQEPVRMITSFSEILAKEYGAVFDNEGKEYLSYIINGGIRMRNLIEDLLAYSRMGNETHQVVEFDGNNTIQGALDNLRELILAKTAEVTFDNMPKMQGNPVQILRLLQNLVANAIKYKAAGNIPRIHISAKDAGEYWSISVQDNGQGIKPEFVEQIFQPFRRLHTWDTVQGTGLGLSICKKIVENHGGVISVMSEPGKGSIFTFTLLKNLKLLSENK